MMIIICQAHLLADPLTIPLMYNLVLWNTFLIKKDFTLLVKSSEEGFCSHEIVIMARQ